MSIFAGHDALVCRLLKLTRAAPEKSTLVAQLLTDRMALEAEERDEFDCVAAYPIRMQRVQWAWNLGVLLQDRPVFVVVGLAASITAFCHALWTVLSEVVAIL